MSTCLDGSSSRDPIFFAVVLDENQVPQLDITGAVAVDAAFMTGDALLVACGRAAVEMNFAARPARAGLAHLPKIFFLAEAAHALRRQAADFVPEFFGFIVVVIDGGVELVLGQAPFFGQEFPGPFDRLGFVIVAERPVAEHFKKSVMVGVAADGFEIVVFAADAQTLLRASGAHVRQAAPGREKCS